MNLAVIGSGGREHALCYKLRKSKEIKKLFCIPGNAGTNKLAENIKEDISNFDKIYQIIKEKKIDFVVIGPEEPLVNGIVAGGYYISGSASIQAKRMKAAGYSDTYMAVVIKAFTTEEKASRFDGWDSINKPDVKTATTLGTTFEKLSKDWFPNSDLTLIEAPARGYQEVLAGRSDVFITSNVEGSTLLSKYPNLREISAEPRNPTPLAMLMPQADQVWINFVDHWIKIKKTRGFFEKLAKKHGL